MINEQQQMFVAEYLIDFNATQAAIRAGYSERSAYSQGHSLLKHPEVSRALREGIAEQVKRLGLDADDIILRLLKLYDRSMQAEPVMKFNHATGEMEDTGEYQFDGKSAAKALELLGKHFGMFAKDKASGSGPFVIQIYGAPKDAPGVRVIDASQPAPAAPLALPTINATPKEKP